MNDELTIQQLTYADELNKLYSDDDIVIVDNVLHLMKLSVARMSMNMLVLCTKGRAQGELNGMHLVLQQGELAICPANVTLSDFMVSPDFEFRAMFFTTRILQSFLRDKMTVWNEVMYVHHMHVVHMTEQNLRFYDYFYEMLTICIQAEKAVYRTEIIQSLLRAAFLGLCGRMKRDEVQRMAEQQATGLNGGSLFQRFLHLLGTMELKHRPVEDYASRLCVSPKYLSAVCKKYSGKTANKWIAEHVMEDIRYQLCHTDHSIKEICDLLGFANPSFFGKYVRQHFGMTPVQLRQL